MSAAHVAALEASVEAQRRDNQRLERLLLELEHAKRLDAPEPPHPRPRPRPQRPQQPPRTERCAPMAGGSARTCAAPPQHVAGLPRRGRGKYAFSLDASFHRWRGRLVRQGVMAPLAGWRRYFAQWQVRCLAAAFSGMRAVCRLKALGRDARCFRALRLWQAHHRQAGLMRAWLAVSAAARLRRRALRLHALRLWSSESNDRKRRRGLLRAAAARWGQHVLLAAVKVRPRYPADCWQESIIRLVGRIGATRALHLGAVVLRRMPRVIPRLHTARGERSLPLLDCGWTDTG